MRFLVISHMFPPSRRPNGKRPGLVVRGMLEAGWAVDVVSSHLGVNDGELESLSHPRLRIIRPVDPVERLCRRLTKHDRLFRGVSLVVNGLLWPDEYVFWSRRAWTWAARQEGYDGVLLFLLPGSLLWKGTGARPASHWVVDYQEPITPFYARHPRRSVLQRALFPRLRAMERRALRLPRKVIFTSNTNRKAYVSEGLVEAERTVHIPYFFHPGDFGPARPVPREQFSISYLGNFDWRGARRPETFLRALALFLERHQELRSQTRFVFYGNWLREHSQFINELGLQDVVSINPPLPHEAYIRCLQESAVLLLVASSFHNLFMPSKLMDYLGAGRPILSFAPADSEVRRVLESAGMGGWASDEDDAAGGVTALERLWGMHRAGALEAPARQVEQWSATTQLRRYLEVVEEGIRGS